MARNLYDWKRFWCPREGRFDLADRGFLVDPEDALAWFGRSDVVSFESIADAPCVVLLGEPGIGKSTALELECRAIEKKLAGTGDVLLRVDLREFQTDQRLAARVFTSRQMEDWRQGAGILHLFFDSLDEALLRIDNIAAVLSSELKKLPPERLRLRLASRTVDWPAGLESSLRNIWGGDRVRVFELVPLRRMDVVTAAKSEGIDPDAFLDAIDALGAAPLANRPVTLRFLMNLFNRGTLYRRVEQISISRDAVASASRVKADGTRKPSAGRRPSSGLRLPAGWRPSHNCPTGLRSGPGLTRVAFRRKMSLWQRWLGARKATVQARRT
jgi:hypothetical protein